MLPLRFIDSFSNIAHLSALMRFIIIASLQVLVVQVNACEGIKVIFVAMLMK